MLESIRSALNTLGRAPRQRSVQSRHGARRGEGGAVAQLLVELPFVALEAGRVAMCSAQARSLHPALLDRLPKVPPLLRQQTSIVLAKEHSPPCTPVLPHMRLTAPCFGPSTAESPQLKFILTWQSWEPGAAKQSSMVLWNMVMTCILHARSAHAHAAHACYHGWIISQRPGRTSCTLAYFIQMLAPFHRAQVCILSLIQL